MSELAQMVMESEGIDMSKKAVIQEEARVAREQSIMEEVARRRAAADAAATQRKSHAIFERFDVDKDGYLNYRELWALGQVTGEPCHFHALCLRPPLIVWRAALQVENFQRWPTTRSAKRSAQTTRKESRKSCCCSCTPMLVLATPTVTII